MKDGRENHSEFGMSLIRSVVGEDVVLALSYQLINTTFD